MIEIRRKRLSFHEDIRKSQRSTIRLEIRKSLKLQQDRTEVRKCLQEAFRLEFDSEDNEWRIWENQSRKNTHPLSPFEKIDKACRQAKLLVGEYEKNQNTILQACQYLFQNLSSLISPTRIHLEQLPQSFVELCIYILRHPVFSPEEKQDFVESFDLKILNECLLGYFVQNWRQISTNECDDLKVQFFIELVKHRNIFLKFDYFSVKNQALLELVVNQIFRQISSQIKVYERFQLSVNLFDRAIVQENQFSLQQDYTSHLQDFYGMAHEKQYYLIKNTVFLANLLLLSPLSNYAIKEMKSKLKEILKHLYRSIFLNPQHQRYKLSAEFCLSVLMAKTVDHNSTDYLGWMTLILNSEIKQQIEKQKRQSNQLEIEYIEKVADQQITQSENFPLLDKQFECLIKKVKFQMICQMVYEMDSVGIQHVERWIRNQFSKKVTYNIFTLQNPQLALCFVQFLKNLLLNHEDEVFTSYSSKETYQNRKMEEVTRARIRIFNMVSRLGFQQLIKHQNVNTYCQKLCQVLLCMIKNLEYGNEIQVCLLNLYSSDQRYYNQQFTQKNDEWSDHYHTPPQMLLSEFKTQVYGLCFKLVQRCYKVLSFAAKQKMFLFMILSNVTTFQKCCQYLTAQQSQKLRKNAIFDYDSYNDDLDNDEIYEDDGLLNQEQTDEDLQKRNLYHGDQTYHQNINQQKQFYEDKYTYTRCYQESQIQI